MEYVAESLAKDVRRKPSLGAIDGDDVHGLSS